MPSLITLMLVVTFLLVVGKIILITVGKLLIQ